MRGYAGIFCSLFILAAIVVENSDSAKILMFAGLASKSHIYAFIPLANALVDKGHDVTLINPFPLSKKVKYNNVVPDLLVAEIGRILGDSNAFGDRVNGKAFGMLSSFILLVLEASVPVCEAVTKSDNVQDIVNNKIKYDLIIVDALANECIYGLAHLQNTKLVQYSTSYLYGWHTQALGLPQTAPYLPHYNLAIGYNDINKLSHRVVFVVTQIIWNLWRRHVVFPKLEKMWEEKSGHQMPSFEKIERDISLMLVNAHSSAKLPQPYTPSVVEVGGIHITPNKTLPKNIASIVDSTGDIGFIVLSLGTVTNSRFISKEYLETFYNALSQLPQTILWKLDLPKEKQINIPSNIIILDWIPQGDLLAHPKCRGFISHGGMLSFLESVYYAVPVVIIPFFADQEIQAYVADVEEIGISVEIKGMTTESLYKATHDIVNIPKYKENMVKRSALFRDQPQSPVEKAVYWVEWAIRHKDTSHLLPVAREWSWFSFYLIDVWIVIAIIFSVPLLLLYLIVKLTFKKLFGNSGKKKLKRH